MSNAALEQEKEICVWFSEAHNQYKKYVKCMKKFLKLSQTDNAHEEKRRYISQAYFAGMKIRKIQRKLDRTKYNYGVGNVCVILIRKMASQVSEVECRSGIYTYNTNTVNDIFDSIEDYDNE